MKKQTSFIHHPQFLYSQNVQLFRSVRLKYYSQTIPVSNEVALSVFCNDCQQDLLNDATIFRSLYRLKRYKYEIIIITASNNRAESLTRLFLSIVNQKFAGSIAWLIVDNGSTDETVKLVSYWQKHLPTFYLNYKSEFGYAAPARNTGLAFLQLSMFKGWISSKYYWVIDSDDYINNEYVVKDLYNAAKSNNYILTHGYTLVDYEDDYGKVFERNTIPRDLDSFFPEVRTLKSELEAGPQILSSIINTQFLPYFYYPDEFTMEDDALNQRIMAYNYRHKQRTAAINLPCLNKTFHSNSMSNFNSMLGDQSLKVKLGPTFVTGIRAQIVLGLINLRDFYTKERL